jgi:ribokinase
MAFHAKIAQSMIEGFGRSLIDILLNVPQKIILNQKHIVDDEMLQIGGVIPTALIFLSRLGVDCTLHTALANDYFGKMTASFITQEKVKLAVIEKPGVSPIAAVLVEKPSGNRTGFYNLGMFAKLSSKDIDSIQFASKSKFLLLDCHNVDCTESLIKKAKKEKLTTILDLGSCKKNVDKLIAAVDVAIIPESFRHLYFPNTSPELVAMKLHRTGPKVCVVTAGEKGSFIASQNKVFFQPAYKVKAVDTNGAGDVFMGGFTYGLIKKWPLKQVAEFAAAAAALACTRFGKMQAIPTELEINKLINNG